ncbi:MAG: hypothetical protein ACP5VP_11615 [Candidatus Limnocylindrales bacterium]
MLALLQADSLLAVTILGFKFSGRLALEIFIVVVVIAVIAWYALARRRA